MEEKRGWGKSLRDAFLGLIGLVLAGAIAKYANLPARVSVLEAKSDATAAAILDIQNNVRAILTLEKNR